MSIQIKKEICLKEELIAEEESLDSDELVSEALSGNSTVWYASSPQMGHIKKETGESMIDGRQSIKEPFFIIPALHNGSIISVKSYADIPDNLLQKTVKCRKIPPVPDLHRIEVRSPIKSNNFRNGALNVSLSSESECNNRTEVDDTEPSPSYDGEKKCARRTRVKLSVLEESVRYRHIRQLNNLASKRLRERKKKEKEELHRQLETLQEENNRLKSYMDELERKRLKLRSLLLKQ